MHKKYILLNGFRKAKKGFTAGFHVPLTSMFSRKIMFNYLRTGHYYFSSTLTFTFPAVISIVGAAASRRHETAPGTVEGSGQSERLTGGSTVGAA